MQGSSGTQVDIDMGMALIPVRLRVQLLSGFQSQSVNQSVYLSIYPSLRRPANHEQKGHTAKVQRLQMSFATQFSAPSPNPLCCSEPRRPAFKSVSVDCSSGFCNCSQHRQNPSSTKATHTHTSHTKIPKKSPTLSIFSNTRLRTVYQRYY